MVLWYIATNFFKEKIEWLAPVTDGFPSQMVGSHLFGNYQIRVWNEHVMTNWACFISMAEKGLGLWEKIHM